MQSRKLRTIKLLGVIILIACVVAAAKYFERPIHDWWMYRTMGPDG